MYNYSAKKGRHTVETLYLSKACWGYFLRHHSLNKPIIFSTLREEYGTFIPFTPESDQRQNSPAASQEYDITQYGELDFS